MRGSRPNIQGFYPEAWKSSVSYNKSCLTNIPFWPVWQPKHEAIAVPTYLQIEESFKKNSLAEVILLSYGILILFSFLKN
ncbi:hypothetical protein ACFL27_21565 [candidate division CSSED10-310 bacterium]|uniref:Uncharacterized protein n=1 Tax=candidate division CSSED10-310 bacterium TaxID=2855610 RepID=A0ABV6Z322_UNCC1